MRELTLNLEDKLEKDFLKLDEDLGYSTLPNLNNINLHFHYKEFYKKEIDMWNENKMYKGLPLQSYIYLNRRKYIGKSALDLTDREILRAFKIIGIHIGNSFHSPFWIKQFIKDYNIKSIFDPCMGWGHRMLGSKDIKYMGNDINPVVVENNRKMADYFNLDVELYNKNAAEFSVEADAVFTCPPYWNTEIYTDFGAENLSYPEFLEWWENVVKISKCEYFAFIINHTYKDDMCSIVSKYFILDKIIEVGKPVYSHLTKRGVKGEFLCVYKQKS